jgi:hypothetical protein
MRDMGGICRWVLMSAVSLLISSRVVQAEIEPSAYAKMQDTAGEALQIEVLKVHGLARRGPDEESHFTVTAKVVCVARSASGLRPGAPITIGYSTVLKRPWGWVGAAPIDMLKPGVYVAYLDKSDAIYTPAARSRSFIASPQGTEPSTVGKLC